MLTKVNLQRPFWGDVSPFSRCEAGFLKTQTKTPGGYFTFSTASTITSNDNTAP
jgi:hypothetical protein